MTFEAWLSENDERVQSAWDEHISYMQDSVEHIRYVATSDACFREFAEEMFAAEGGALE